MQGENTEHTMKKAIDKLHYTDNCATNEVNLWPVKKNQEKKIPKMLKRCLLLGRADMDWSLF